MERELLDCIIRNASYYSGSKTSDICAWTTIHLPEIIVFVAYEIPKDDVDILHRCFNKKYSSGAVISIQGLLDDFQIDSNDFEKVYLCKYFVALLIRLKLCTLIKHDGLRNPDFSIRVH